MEKKDFIIEYGVLKKYVGPGGDVVIPEGVTYIANDAFYESQSITGILIPGSVRSMGERAFNLCVDLERINVSENNTNYSSVDGVLFDKEKTTLIHYPANKDSDLYIIPEGITNVDDYAFLCCLSLKEIIIPDTVTKLSGTLFWGCYELTGINVDENNTNYSSVDGVLFDKEKRTLLQYPANKTEEVYIIPDGVTSINLCSFSGCGSLITICIPDSVTDIGYEAFEECEKLTYINVTSNNANYSSVDGVLFDKEKTKILKYPVNKTGDVYVVPDSVTSIYMDAFKSCTILESIIIPKSVTSLSDFPFRFCSNLKDIYYKGSESAWEELVFLIEFPEGVAVHFECD